MNQIKNYKAEKYSEYSEEYKEVKDGVYEVVFESGKYYVTSLSFIQEPNLGEGKDASDISQYPVEDILNKYYCHITDFYDEQNKEGSLTCVLEFASDDIEDVCNLREIIGKHIYNKELKENGNSVIKLIIES